MILVLFIGATGLRIIRHSHNVPKKEWFLFGIPLWLCMLTRQINAVLAGLLPLTFFLLVLFRLICGQIRSMPIMCRMESITLQTSLPKSGHRCRCRHLIVVLANASLRTCATPLKCLYHSVVGFAFLGRIKFLARLPVQERNQLLDKASKNTNSADVKELISLLRNEFNGRAANWDADAFKRSAQASLVSIARRRSLSRGDSMMRSTAWSRAFLCPPDKILIGRSSHRFQKIQGITIPEVVSFLFVSTKILFSHREAMPQCASLVTFRGKERGPGFRHFQEAIPIFVIRRI